ncbi:MAG: AbrB/MazE/SpoVT family DNA-binding domain-containing protein [Candidatus Nanohaloarchaea archaeon]|nr:AbrB/MazE/SpoVT family DNA-binding domain-containing protein [Candidatus Nanohaloarchaea archaeon]
MSTLRTGAFTTPASASFIARLDDRGRIVIPANVRDSLALEYEDTVRVELRAVEVETFSVDGPAEAQERLADLSNIRSFTYSNGELRVMADDG